MTTPRTGGGGGGGGGPSRRGRMGEVPVVNEPTANNNNDHNNNNSNNNTTAATQKTGGAVSRLPSIKERRPSVQKKARTSSVNEASNDSPTVTTSTSTTTTTTTTLLRQESTSTATTTPTSTTTPTIQRRSSVNQGLGQRGGARPTFAGIGRRVSSMVRARMAFQSRRKSSTVTAEEVNHMEAIHEMPRNPRFTTFLSAEAQYAMMKGYEDMLYEKIAKSNPESRLVMKRTKTPFHKKVSIVDNEHKDQGDDGKKKNRAGGNPSGTDTTTTTTTTTITPISPTPSAAMSPDSEDLESVDDASGDSNRTTLPSPFGKPGRSQSTVSQYVSKSSSSSSYSPRASGSVGFALHRSSSLPTLKTGLSHQKRLVLTYRLESAMDILDTLKRRNKEHSLSPRVYRIPRQVDAVKDFNSWTKVWNKEFKVVHAK